jgi:hypothetical protein
MAMERYPFIVDFPAMFNSNSGFSAWRLNGEGGHHETYNFWWANSIANPKLIAIYEKMAHHSKNHQP